MTNFLNNTINQMQMQMLLTQQFWAKFLGQQGGANAHNNKQDNQDCPNGQCQAEDKIAARQLAYQSPCSNGCCNGQCS